MAESNKGTESKHLHFVSSWEQQHDAWFRDSRGVHVRRYECDVCGVDCQGQKGLEAHLSGSKKCKRKRRLDAAAKAVGRTISNSMAATTSGAVAAVAGADSLEPKALSSEAENSLQGKKKKRKKGRREISPMDLFRRHIGQCTGKKDLKGAIRAFEENKANGIRANVKIYNSLLHMCTSQEYGTDDERNAAASIFLEDIDSRDDFQFDEALYSTAIKLRCLAGYVSSAKELLGAMKADGWKPKRRTYAPIIESHPKAHLDNLRELNSVYLEAERDGVEFSEAEFRHMLQACLSARTSLVVDGKNSVNLSGTSAGTVAAVASEGGISSCQDFFEITLHRMKELVPHASREILEVLKLWSEQHSDNTSLSKCNIVMQNNATEGSSIQTRCVCSACGGSLKSIDLTSDQNAQILEQIATGLAHDGSTTNNSGGTTQFEYFKSWIGRNFPRGVDFIIDGANVGYFGRRPPKDRLSFEQIDRVIQAVNEMGGKQVLLILHQRHFKRLPDRDSRLVDSWKRNRILYQTPHRMNDDWFWLYAAIYSSQFIQQPLVITNDQMRDHHFQMLSQRCFLKWRERHVVRFGFKNLYNHRVPPTFWFPLPYSTRIQNNIQDNESDHAKSLIWHFPVRQKGDKPVGPGVVSSEPPNTNGKHNAANGTNAVEKVQHNFDWYCFKYISMGKQANTHD